MPSKARPSKRDAILDAMLDVVVERGFHEAPMSLIAKRAGASAGVIYHHFSSKEEIIQALYQRIATLKYTSFFGDFSVEAEPREPFLRLWANVYGFSRNHRREARFLEQFAAAGFPCTPALPPDDPRMLAFHRRFTNRSRGGVLCELPAPVLEEMTVGLATRLAALPAPLSHEELRLISEKVWGAIEA